MCWCLLRISTYHLIQVLELLEILFKELHRYLKLLNLGTLLQHCKTRAMIHPSSCAERWDLHGMKLNIKCNAFVFLAAIFTRNKARHIQVTYWRNSIWSFICGGMWQAEPELVIVQGTCWKIYFMFMAIQGLKYVWLSMSGQMDPLMCGRVWDISHPISTIASDMRIFTINLWCVRLLLSA